MTLLADFTNSPIGFTVIRITVREFSLLNPMGNFATSRVYENSVRVEMFLRLQSKAKMFGRLLFVRKLIEAGSQTFPQAIEAFAECRTLVECRTLTF